ncbi:MAG: polysaccharide deacetylase family protein [Gemmatimonadetes bacterium]|nr:polysaccharide deacetylase family protein [Gemmatimonadota bacterium]
MKLLVSIHDVAPPNLAEVAALWSLCTSLGVQPALLVVPNWHGAHPLGEHPETVDWVRACARAGASILLHGQRHDEAGLARSVVDHLAAVGRTAREGEFLTLGAAAALGRIQAGVDVLRGLGLDPVGFVPPAWLARPAHRRAVRDAGLALTEDTGAIWLVRRDVRLASLVIRWSGRAAWRARVSDWLADRRATTRVPLLRVALHPSDLRSPVTAASIHRVLPALVRVRTVLTYETLAREEDLGCAA